jgi:hypothetical protein
MLPEGEAEKYMLLYNMYVLYIAVYNKLETLFKTLNLEVLYIDVCVT